MAAAILVRWGCEADRLSVTAEWGHGVAAIGTAAIGVAATGTAAIGVEIGIIIITTVVLTSSSSAVFRSGAGAGGIRTATVMAPHMATAMVTRTATEATATEATATEATDTVITATVMVTDTAMAMVTDKVMATDPQLHTCSGGLPRLATIMVRLTELWALKRDGQFAPTSVIAVIAVSTAMAQLNRSFPRQVLEGKTAFDCRSFGWLTGGFRRGKGRAAGLFFARSELRTCVRPARDHPLDSFPDFFSGVLAGAGVVVFAGGSFDPAVFSVAGGAAGDSFLAASLYESLR